MSNLFDSIYLVKDKLISVLSSLTQQHFVYRTELGINGFEEETAFQGEKATESQKATLQIGTGQHKAWADFKVRQNVNLTFGSFNYVLLCWTSVLTRLAVSGAT